MEEHIFSALMFCFAPYPLSWLYNLFKDYIDKALRSALQKQVATHLVD